MPFKLDKSEEKVWNGTALEGFYFPTALTPICECSPNNLFYILHQGTVIALHLTLRIGYHINLKVQKTLIE